VNAPLQPESNPINMILERALAPRPYVVFISSSHYRAWEGDSNPR
jgi:hypothetical protein